MTTYSRAVWSQLKNKTVQDIMRALRKDGWVEEDNPRSTVAFRHPDRTDPAHSRVVFHVHPKKTMGAKLLRGLLDTIDWSESDLARLGLIKVRGKRPGRVPP